MEAVPVTPPAPAPAPAVAEVVAMPGANAPAAIEIPTGKLSKRDLIIAGCLIVILCVGIYYITRPKESAAPQ